MSPCRTRYFLVLFLKPWPQAGLCTRPHLLCSKLNVTRYEEELVAGVRFKNQKSEVKIHIMIACVCKRRAVKPSSGITIAVKALTKGRETEQRKGKLWLWNSVDGKWDRKQPNEKTEGLRSWHQPSKLIFWGHKSVSVMWVKIHNLCLQWKNSKCWQYWSTIKVDWSASERIHWSGPGKHFAFNLLMFLL